MDQKDAAVLKQINTECRVLLSARNAVENAQRYFFSPGFEGYHPKLLKHLYELELCRRTLEKFPDNQAQFQDLKATLDQAIFFLCEVMTAFIKPQTGGPEEIITRLLKANRKYCRAQEMLFPLRHLLPAVDELFLERPATEIALRDSTGIYDSGLVHMGAGAEPYTRGAFSVYIPENFAGKSCLPLVVALHGGLGHGRDFIWSWLREARCRNFMVLAPTSSATTWAITQPDKDRALIRSALDQVMERWPVDKTQILLTGISDGGTFALTCALEPNSIFTGFAIIAGTLPPLNLKTAKGKRILWVHGELDWMFPVSRARFACTLLQQAGADITLEVVPNLSHVYPREQNSRILLWFGMEPDKFENPDLRSEFTS